MNLSRISWIALKELVETLRDRRAMLSMLIFPLVFVPIVGQISLIGMSPSIAKYAVAFVNLDGGPLSNQIGELLKMTNGTQTTFFASVPADLEQALKSSKFDVALIMPQGFSSNITQGLQSQITIVTYPGSTRSLMAMSIFTQVIDSFEQVLIAQRLTSLGLSPDIVNPIGLNVTSFAKEGEQQFSPLGFMQPFFIVITAFTSMLGIGLEKSVGEKDKGTLEALLSSPASRIEILIGKLTSMLPFGLLSILATIGGLVIGGVIGSSLVGEIGGGVRLLSFDPIYLPIIVVSIPIFLVQGGGLILLIGFFAKTLKEAQTYASAPTLFLSVGTIVAFFLPSYMGRILSLVPLMGIAILQNLYISEGFSYFVMSVLSIQIAYAALFTTLAARIVNAERLLASSS